MVVPLYFDLGLYHVIKGDIDTGLELFNRSKSLAEEIIRKKLTVREAEKQISSLRQGTKTQKAPAKRDPNTVKLEKEISESLGAKVDIKHNKKGRGKLTISFNNLDELQGILEKIKK